MSANLEPAFDKVFDTQRIYRLMLDAMARPGKILALPRLDIYPPSGLSGYASGLAFTLLDGETSFAVLPGNSPWQDYLAVNTGARPVSPADAEFVLLAGGEYAPQIAGVSRGSLLAPERGATLFVMVDALSANGGGVRLTLTGPGIEKRREVAVDGLNLANLDNILTLNQEYPLGVDTFFTDRQGCLMALPRSSAVGWEVIS
jgi:alpha-D-ribose 1-methylphosphonate 5-triphosphate synthase subunit PhnH